MARIIVEYNPPISIETQELIRREVTPSMISNDETSGQYEISQVADVVEAQEGEMANKKDLFFINDLINEGVHYIEF
jgi:hypothetical protein